MENNSTHLLFVYGTLLLPDNVHAQFLLNNAEFISTGRFPGRLFDLGSYPGAIYDRLCYEFVFGKVFRMLDREKTLSHLDIYEGLEESDSEYERKIVEVESAVGMLPCYTYVYIRNTAEKPQITGGDYEKYLSNRK